MTDRATAPANALSVSIRDERGAPVLGNVFITVASPTNGEAHRELHYDPRNERYLFPRLRPGQYVCSITAAGYESESRPVQVERAPAALDVRLRARTHQGPLVLSAEEEWKAAQAMADGLWRGTGEPLPDALSLETRLLIAFLGDQRLIATLTSPLETLELPKDLVAYLRDQISGGWTFLVGAKAAAELVRQLADSRARLYAATCSVFRNDLVCELAGRRDVNELHEAALEIVRALDSPELLELLPILMRRLCPQRAPMAYFVQAAVDLFRAQLPPRVARRRAKPKAPSPPLAAQDAPARLRRVVHRLDDSATGESPRVAAVARAAAWAIRGR
jgi:hypothetical protein